MIRLHVEAEGFAVDKKFLQKALRAALDSAYAARFRSGFAGAGQENARRNPAAGKGADKKSAGQDGATLTLDVSVLDDAAITELNERFKKHKGATDVLAFDDGTPDAEAEDAVHLGDVAVSAETAEREAAARGVPAREELALYCVHGTLHLLGLRDGTPKQRAAMREAEREVLQTLGVEPKWD